MSQLSKLRITLVVPALLAASLQLGCGGGLFGVNLVFVAEQTALERQVLGAYEEIGRDLAVYTSVRAVDPDGNLVEPPAMTTSQAEVLRAMNNRRYNRDDLDTLLASQIFREGNDGRLSLNPVPVSTWPIPEPLVMQILEEENRDRDVILARLLETTPGIVPSDREEVVWILANRNHQAAPPTSLIQDRAGNWRSK